MGLSRKPKPRLLIKPLISELRDQMELQIFSNRKTNTDIYILASPDVASMLFDDTKPYRVHAVNIYE